MPSLWVVMVVVVVVARCGVKSLGGPPAAALAGVLAGGNRLPLGVNMGGSGLGATMEEELDAVDPYWSSSSLYLLSYSGGGDVPLLHVCI